MNPILKCTGIALLSGVIGYFFTEALESKIIIPDDKKELSLTGPKFKKTFLSKDTPETLNIKTILNKPLTNKTLITLSEYIQTLDENQIKTAIKQYSLDRASNILHLLYERWGEINPEAALKQSARQPGEYFSEAGKYDYSIFKAWLKKDPQAALAFYNQGNKLTRPHEITKLIARQKLSENPTEGFKWIIDTMDSQKHKNYFNVFNDYVLTKPPQDIYNDISQMKLSFEMRDNLLKTIAAQWALQDWNKTKSWLNTLSTNDKGAAYSSALEYYATKKPLDALSEITQDDIKSNIFVLYPVLPFLLKDPSIPAEWMSRNYKLDDPRGLENITRAWITTEPEKCMAFLDQFPSSNLKKSAISNILKYGEDVPLLKKINYFQQLKTDTKSNYEDSDYLIDQNIRAAYGKDAESTQKWINESNLPAERKEVIIENMKMFYSLGS